MSVMLATCMVMSPASADAQVRYKLNKEKIALQLRTNGLYDLALCPNIGMEFQTNLGLAFQIDYIGASGRTTASRRNYAITSETMSRTLRFSVTM